jgi:LAO/AO transport system kinase
LFLRNFVFYFSKNLFSTEQLKSGIEQGDTRALARAISIVENELSGYEELLQTITIRSAPVIGFTGAPGAGKSTLLNSLLTHLSVQGKRIAVVAVDPTSPFNYGSVLGDRIRMVRHFNNENIFIRSVATRGSLGGLSDKILEITDVLRAAPFDYILVETVGVGQSEVEIAGLADISVVVLMPDSGDDIQAMKSGLLEIADIFVVNKSDHTDADKMVRNLKMWIHEYAGLPFTPPVLKTIAVKDDGTDRLLLEIENILLAQHRSSKKINLLTEKAWRFIQKEKMKSTDRKKLQEEIGKALKENNFNLYRFIKKYIKG